MDTSFIPKGPEVVGGGIRVQPYTTPADEHLGTTSVRMHEEQTKLNTAVEKIEAWREIADRNAANR